MGPCHCSEPHTRVALSNVDDDVSNDSKKDKHRMYGSTIWILPNSLFSGLLKNAKDTNDLKSQLFEDALEPQMPKCALLLQHHVICPHPDLQCGNSCDFSCTIYKHFRQILHIFRQF